MNIKLAGKISGGQDGAIWGQYLFRFNEAGKCVVHDLRDNLREISQFVLDKNDILSPHSNAVMFGREYFSPDDEFPLLYTNIYNNYATAVNPLRGVCCVYRLQRTTDGFTTTLVQLIEVGFVEDSRYWRSSDEVEDVRPYGNFSIDRDAALYYGFTMRDKWKTTRYFSFKLPKLADGIMDETYGVNRVVLNAGEILDQFDCEYHQFIQGACIHNGLIYSLEGFAHDPGKPPAIRVIDPKEKRQLLYVPFGDFGMTAEPEFIDFDGETCYYAEAPGELYIIEF